MKAPNQAVHLTRTFHVRQRKMQPSSARGNKLRFAMMPISWAVAFMVVWILMLILSAISGETVRGLLRSDSLWILCAILPCLILGKVLGLITINLIAFAMPPLRRVFDREASETGRHGFAEAMCGLARVAGVLSVLTVVGATLFLRYR